MSDLRRNQFGDIEKSAGEIADEITKLHGRLYEYKLSVMEDLMGGDSSAPGKDFGERHLVELGSLLEGDDIEQGPSNMRYSDEGVIVITPESVESLRFVRERCRCLTGDGDPSGEVDVRGSDIVMAIGGERAGACAIMPVFFEGGVLAPGCLRLAARTDSVEPFYLVNVLHYHFRKSSLDAVMAHNGERTVNIQLLKKLPVYLPPLDEQKKIAGELLRISGLIVKAEDARERVEEILEELG